MRGRQSGNNTEKFPVESSRYRFLQPSSWSLQSKFLFGTAMILLVFCLAGTLVIYFHQKRELEAQALEKSELVMAAVASSRQYVIEELRPVMFELVGDEHFVLQAMSSSYVGRAFMDRFSPALPEVYYRRTSLNARNPAYEVNEMELGMLEYFRANPDEKIWQGIAEVNERKEFKRFEPVIFTRGCLQCHGRPEDAPWELVEMYGPTGGFGRTEGEIGGVVSVGIPVQAALGEIRERAIYVFMVVFLALSLIFISMGILFNRVVITSLKDLLGEFQEASGVSPLRARNELDRLGSGFNAVMQELHASREKLQNWNRTLEEEIARARKELESAQTAAIYNEKMAALGRMTANITHAIRNPLTAMGGFARRIEAVAGSEREQNYARIILKEMYRLEKILRDLVVFSRDRCCAMPFKPEDLDKVVRRSLKPYHDQLKEQDVQVHLDIPADLPPVPMDEDMIGMVLENLLDNALHAMPHGGEIKISATLLNREIERKTVKLSLADTGPGVPGHIMAVLFEPFSTTKEHSLGSGLGLPLCRKIMEEHGGRIEAENLPGRGAVFHLYFPVRGKEDTA